MTTANKSTLFLGDLSTFCTERDIHTAFAPFGEILEIKIMRSEETFRNLSYGFIKFRDSAAAKKAMNGLNGVLFCGRHLRIGWASYKNKKEPKTLFHHDRIESSSVHISYISYQLKNLITEESLRILFSQYGVVLDTSIKKSYIDESINRQCGYGFVHFSSSQEGIESALAAVAGLNDATIDNVCYKCSISHNLEKYLLELQTQRIELMQDNYRLSSSPNSVGELGHLSTAHEFNKPAKIGNFDYNYESNDRIKFMNNHSQDYRPARQQTDYWSGRISHQQFPQTNPRASFPRNYSDNAVSNSDCIVHNQINSFGNSNHHQSQSFCPGSRSIVSSNGGNEFSNNEFSFSSGSLSSYGLSEFSFGESSLGTTASHSLTSNTECGPVTHQFFDNLLNFSTDDHERDSFSNRFGDGLYKYSFDSTCIESPHNASQILNGFDQSHNGLQRGASAMAARPPLSTLFGSQSNMNTNRRLEENLLQRMAWEGCDSGSSLLF